LLGIASWRIARAIQRVVDETVNSSAMTAEVKFDPVPFRVVLDAEAPWPRGIPDLETARRALLERVRVPELPTSVQERIEESFQTISSLSEAETECLKVAATVRWRLAAAAAIAPGGSGRRFRRVKVDEGAAAALQSECEEVARSLALLAESAPDRPELDVLRARFGREFANFRELLDGARKRAASTASAVVAKGAGPRPSTQPAYEVVQPTGTPLVENSEPSRTRLYVLACLTAATMVAAACLFLWPQASQPPPLDLPTDVPAENIILAKDGSGLLFSPEGRPIERSEAERYAKSFVRQGIAVIEAAPGQYLLAPMRPIDAPTSPDGRR